MCEVECSILISILAEKTGNYNSILRNACRDMIFRCSKLTNPGKIMENVLKVLLTTKNARTRYELIVIVKDLVVLYNLEILNSKDLCCVINKYINKDANMHTAVLSLVDECYG